MKLKSIRLVNFRQFKNTFISFATDDNKKVTFIMADNSSGKTTLSQAFKWCLYGQSNLNNSLLNIEVAENLLSNNTDSTEMSVEISLSHKNCDYTIKRSKKYTKFPSKQLNDTIAPIVEIFQKNENGETLEISPFKTDTEINDLLPESLFDYFFINGEQIERVSKQINEKKKNKDFNEAILKLTDLCAYQNALLHLKPKGARTVINKLNTDIANNGDEKFKLLMLEKANLETQKSQTEQKLATTEEEINNFKGQEIQLKLDINKFAETEKLNKQLIQIKEQTNKTNLEFNKKIADSHTLFDKYSTSFLAQNMVKEVLQIITKDEYKNNNIPNISASVIDKLIANGKCICGESITVNDEHYQMLLKLKKYLPTVATQSTDDKTKMFINTATSYYSDFDFSKSWSDKNTEVSNLKNELENLSHETSKLEGEIEKCGLNNKDLNEIITKKKNLEYHINCLIEQRGELKNQIKTLDYSIYAKNREIEPLKNSNEKNKVLNKAVELTLKLYNKIEAEYNEKESRFRRKLTDKVNAIFSSTFNTNLELTIDENYNLEVKDRNEHQNVAISDGQLFTAYFGFILGVIELSQELKLEHSDSTVIEPYPLVMDAPFSNLDKKRIENICDTVLQIAKQIIIFIKDTDGEHARECLRNSIGRTYSFQKNSDYDVELREEY